MQVHYLEIVTPEVDAVCAAYAAANGVEFGEPDAGLGNARTTTMPGGGMLGVRAPMHDAEEPVVRMTLEVILLPVADVDRAKEFYEQMGFHCDVDHQAGPLRVVQFTPTGAVITGTPSYELLYTKAAAYMRIGKAAWWNIADTLNAMEAAYGERYTQVLTVAEYLKLSVDTVNQQARAGAVGAIAHALQRRAQSRSRAAVTIPSSAVAVRLVHHVVTQDAAQLRLGRPDRGLRGLARLRRLRQVHVQPLAELADGLKLHHGGYCDGFYNVAYAHCQPSSSAALGLCCRARLAAGREPGVDVEVGVGRFGHRILAERGLLLRPGHRFFGRRGAVDHFFVCLGEQAKRFFKLDELGREQQCVLERCPGDGGDVAAHLLLERGRFGQ